MGDWDLSPNVWLAVLEDLKEYNLFRGIYDAGNGNDSFMHGVAMVMETIALRVSEKEYIKFCNEFMANMIASEDKCEERKNEGT